MELSIQNVSMTYPNGKQALRALNPHQPDPVAGIYGCGRFIRDQKGGLAHQRCRNH